MRLTGREVWAGLILRFSANSYPALTTHIVLFIIVCYYYFYLSAEETEVCRGEVAGPGAQTESVAERGFEPRPSVSGNHIRSSG